MTITIDSRNGLTLTLFPSSTEAEIVQNIYCILNTVLGSVPLLRDYGLSNDFMHKPVPSARSAYAAAIADAISLYEPRVQIKNVDFSADTDKPWYLCPIMEVTINE